jgi:putative toxin-antitoxin system antitoxin component (TIGR02293 family)
MNVRTNTSLLARPGLSAVNPAVLPAIAPDFWAKQLKKSAPYSIRKTRDPHSEKKRELNDLVSRVSGSAGVELFNAVEAGVPTHVVNMIADATGEPIGAVMDLIGVSPTTFRRKEEAKERLPDVAGHRVMGYLRVVATLRKLLEESGDPEAMKSFDVQAWVAQWVRVALPELGGKTPAEMLRNPEGQRAVEQVLERMRGGLVA